LGFDFLVQNYKIYSYCDVIYSRKESQRVHYFSDLFDKVLYMFWTGPLPIISSISALYTYNRYLSC